MELNSIPRLAPGCRLHPTDGVLLIPEGTLNLTGPSREILAMLDGKRTISDVVAALVQQYEGVDEREIGDDVLSLLNRLEQRGVLREGV
ncbi:pyrroloquinoline quinone biosynthesis peptide chaperone PqqD [Edaphobacter sp. 12200R-103]|jgi:pyrroloquinoline quinone biosynthesis protein D|uniref:pyrroloquinoline quinone biosynthesis peptide chaperone PqqD n=1 Tax=Edaphobacter sp. 12200R-103 TaxID=2703788 RepID=UPI00138D8C62|nr:pyrroloquinoline quinone biosynthesis peptide chaperone PqqD [Edaphobacter sp. 12200R-103]QHS52012.1 pyrroloquinoline quinone biosynthesis peptide chaperone PqqD [Edaphobacter sp. 12200R-103]